MIDLQFKQVPAAIKKTCAYWGHVEDIAVDTHNDLVDALQDSVQSYLSTFFSLLDSAASIGMVSTGRTNVTSPLVIEQPPAPQNDPVVIVDSSGNVVSSSPRMDLH
jgi:hypothetical protein